MLGQIISIITNWVGKIPFLLSKIDTTELGREGTPTNTDNKNNMDSSLILFFGDDGEFPLLFFPTER